MSQWYFIMGKTTTTMPLLCGDPDSVDGETSGFRTASYPE